MHCLLVTLLLALVAAAPSEQLDTRYYRVHSDLGPALTRDLGGEMDAMFDEYARRFASFGVPAAADRLDVHLFADRADYIAFVGQANQHSGGVFIPGRGVLAAYLGDGGRDGLRATLRHEAFHQFADLVIGDTMPVWLNEGLAQLFEDGHWHGGVGAHAGGRFRMGGVSPHRLRRWRADARRGTLPALSDLVALGHDDWWGHMHDPERAGAQYNAAWAAAHFFVYAADAEGRPLLRERLIYLLKLLHAGYDGEEAFRRSVGDATAGVDDALRLYVGSLAPDETTLAMEAQQVRADMLRHLAEAGLRPGDVGEFRELVLAHGYRLEYQADSVRWMTAEDPGVYFADPLGRPLPRSMLFFDHRRAGPIPDLVAFTSAGTKLHTRFHQTATGLDAVTTVGHP